MLTIDGQLLNDANTGDVDISQLPVAAFNAVSVTEGLGPEDLEGSSTIGGAVNLISLRPTRDPHLGFSVSAGSFGRSEGWYNATGSAKKFGYAFALDDQQEAGFVNETAPVCPIGGAPPCASQHLGSADSQRSALADLDYTPSENADVGFRFFTLGDSRDQSAAITGLQGGRLYGPGPQQFSQSIRAYQLHGRAPLGAGELVALLETSDNNVDVSGGGVGNPLYDLSHRDLRTTESLQWQRSLERSEIAFGGYVRQETFVAPGAIPQLSQDIESYFVRGAWQPSAKVHLSAGAYESRYTTFGLNLDGRFGAIYDADPSTAIRFSLGTGFRAPLLIE
ncbi:MAG: TonB-dependent receptor plug domain-containing protein, partial [Rhodanobacteraceae bacterium]